MNHESTVTKAAAEQSPVAERTRTGMVYRPNVDILEKDDDLLVVAEMPGAKGDAIEVKFEDGTLEIHAPVESRQDGAQQYLLQEYGIGDYYRTFQVSESIDAQKISADFADGLLTLRLPKSEAVKPRRIAVQAK